MPYKILVYKQMAIRVIVCHCVALATLGNMGKEEWKGKGKKNGKERERGMKRQGEELENMQICEVGRFCPPSFGL